MTNVEWNKQKGNGVILYLTGEDTDDPAGMQRVIETDRQLVKAGYTVLWGAMSEAQTPAREAMQTCHAVALMNRPETRRNRMLPVEYGYAEVYGRDVHYVGYWLEQADKVRRDQAEAETRGKQMADDLRELRTIVDEMIRVTPSTESGDQPEKQDTQFDTSSTFVLETQETQEAREDGCLERVIVEVTPDGFLHVVKNIWATDVQVEVVWL